MLTDKELVDAFLTEKTIFLGEEIFKHSGFSACKVIKVEFMGDSRQNIIACVTVVSEDGIIHHVHHQDFMNLFDQESIRDKLNFSLASNSPL